MLRLAAVARSAMGETRQTDRIKSASVFASALIQIKITTRKIPPQRHRKLPSNIAEVDGAPAGCYSRFTPNYFLTAGLVADASGASFADGLPVSADAEDVEPDLESAVAACRARNSLVTVPSAPISSVNSD